MANQVNVCKQPTPLNRWGDLFYVEFTFNSPKFNTNIYCDGKGETLRRLYLSPLTLCLFNKVRIHQQRGGSWQIPPKTVKELWHQVNRYMSQYGAIKQHFPEYKQKVNSIPVNFKHFCNSAISVTEFGEGVNVPNALVEYLIGRNRSYSIAMKNIRSLHTPNIKPIECCYLSELIIDMPFPSEKTKNDSKVAKSNLISHKAPLNAECKTTLTSTG